MDKMLWLDMEMTGLSPDVNVPIEVAAIVTAKDFSPLEKYEAVIFQPASELSKMDSWNTEHHGKSGLTAKIPHGKQIAQVETELCLLIDRHFQNERPVLCGNSIGQDRLFVRAHFPRLEAKLHYRMLDVSSWKVVFQALYQKKFEKIGEHRALDDIQESINELKFYLSFVKP